MHIIVSTHYNWRRVTDRMSRFRLSETVPSYHYKESVWSDINCKLDTWACNHFSGSVRPPFYVGQTEDSIASAKTGDEKYDFEKHF